MTHRQVDTHFIGGEFRTPSRAGRIDVHDSNTGSAIGHAPNGTSDDVDAAVEAADNAFPSWSALPAGERADHLRALAAALQERQEELAQVIAREVGAPISLCRGAQTELAALNFTKAAQIAEGYQYSQHTGSSLVTREPIGVVGAITAWNFPLHLVTLKAAFAMAAGNTVVVKPSEVAPLSTAILCEVVVEASLPAGVFNVVHGTGPEAGEAIVTHAGVRMVSFTGSTKAGRRIGELAANHVKKATLELGGKSPLVILEGADIASAVTFGIHDLLINNGQRCDSLTRFVVPRAALPAIEKLVSQQLNGRKIGTSWDETTDIGPMVSEVQRERVMEYVQLGEEEGARLLVGGSEADLPTEGYFVAPMAFSDVRRTMRIAREEIFGPVLVLQPYDDVDEAVTIANDTDYGLRAAVWSETPESAIQVALKIDAGIVTINDGAADMNAPTGGYKMSGIGREGGIVGFEEFLEHKTLALPA